MKREQMQAQLEKEAHELEDFIRQVPQEIARRQGRLQLLRELLAEKEGEHG
jgi:hypothetical protein